MADYVKELRQAHAEVIGCSFSSCGLSDYIEGLEQELEIAIEIIEDCGVDFDEIAAIKRGES